MLKSLYAQDIVHMERLTSRGVHVGLTTRAHQAYNISKERTDLPTVIKSKHSLTSIQAQAVHSVEELPVGRLRYPRETRAPLVPILPGLVQRSHCPAQVDSTLPDFA
jgi:hypothetical protein